MDVFMVPEPFKIWGTSVHQKPKSCASCTVLALQRGCSYKPNNLQGNPEATEHTQSPFQTGVIKAVLRRELVLRIKMTFSV